MSDARSPEHSMSQETESTSVTRSATVAVPEGDRRGCVQQNQSNDGHVERLDLIELWDILRAGKRTVLLTAAVFVALAAAYLAVARPVFRAEVLMIPVSQGESNSLTGRLGQMGGLAGIAGLAGLTIGAPSSAEPVAVLQSREFAREFIETKGILPQLAEALRGPAGFAFGTDATDSRAAVDHFVTRVRKVTEDNKKGLVRLSIEWQDPILAAGWANAMAAQVNEKLRQHAIADATANIDYLRKRLYAEEVVSIQQVISRLIESELQRLMLAEGRSDYAFRVVDPAEVPRKKVRPARLQIVVLAVMLGTIFGALWVLTKESIRRGRAARVARQGD